MQEIAQELISSSTALNDQGDPINPLDGHFRSLGLTAMEPVARDCGEFTTLQSYVRDTHGETHRHYQVDIINAFRVEREQETEAWNHSGFDRLANGERLLLWHGSRTTNFAGACVVSGSSLVLWLNIFSL
jgi:poly [ADP-ribose] polymerase